MRSVRRSNRRDRLEMVNRWFAVIVTNNKDGEQNPQILCKNVQNFTPNFTSNVNVNRWGHSVNQVDQIVREPLQK